MFHQNTLRFLNIRRPVAYGRATFPRLRALFLAAVALCLGGCAGPEFPNVTHFSTVVVDAGHGGHDSGASTRSDRVVSVVSSKKGKHGRKIKKRVTRVIAPSGPRLLEKDLALDVSIRVQRKLRSAGLRVVMTRHDDTFISLDDRVSISNNQHDSIFVAIHFNDSRRRGAHGQETYHNNRGTAELAGRIERAISACAGGENRGVRRANYRVLRLSRGPALLVECAYLSNPEEAARCADPAFREQIASAIVRAILEQRR